MTKDLPVIIVGGGPVGLAAAAELHEKGEAFVVLEAGMGPGTNFLNYGHVRLFSPWKYNMNNAARRLLTKYKVALPDPEKLPLGKDIVTEYLLPLTELPEMKPNIYFGTRVVHISRKGFDKMKSKGRKEAPFHIITENADGERKVLESGTVIDATGTWERPNSLIPGGDLLTEKRMNRIFYGIPNNKHAESSVYINSNTAVVGSGHSAMQSLLELLEVQQSHPETTISWIHRKPGTLEALGGGEQDQLPARGKLGRLIKSAWESGKIQVFESFYIESVNEKKDQLTLSGIQNNVPAETEPFDYIICNTGSRSSFEFLGELRWDRDAALECVPALAPLIDPNVHSCGTVRPHGEKELRQPEENVYIIGAKSYGRAPTFLLATGYEQARSVAAYIAGDKAEAAEVHLELPETGVCSAEPASRSPLTIAVSGGCCS
ncbi:pyridine nucleotide-disulfide oxidoreductase [Sinobaca qinghaiensis]|uniref:Pyridine nucleotide-disulfide oxidoreductase n=1 Tax=Sinobaca qinghaiensis TaxID=342944 RepID=A0A419V530_9BACL|nr:NAD(P)-binding domain-containing protein [Sinobaca qinghaiensis]RKD73551.1 pyridine nucleotide-disulfide oxidoreductase [Sinobaca qinghaiensis]